MLLVDADPQPSLSSYYDIEKTPETTGLTSLLTTDAQPLPARTSVNNLDIIISDDPSGALENLLLPARDGRFRIAAARDRIQGYDVAPNAGLAATKVDLIKWVFGINLAIATLLVAIHKFL